METLTGAEVLVNDVIRGMLTVMERKIDCGNDFDLVERAVATVKGLRPCHPGPGYAWKRVLESDAEADYRCFAADQLARTMTSANREAVIRSLREALADEESNVALAAAGSLIWIAAVVGEELLREIPDELSGEDKEEIFEEFIREGGFAQFGTADCQ